MRTVSLLVTPEQAEKVTFASNLGQVQLVMRGSLDKVSAAKSSNGTTYKSLFGGGETPGDREDDKVAATPDEKPAEPKGNNFMDALREGMLQAAKAAPATAAAKATKPAQPAADAFTMVGYDGVNGTQYVFADPNKPPQVSNPLGGGTNSGAQGPATDADEPATTDPAVDPANAPPPAPPLKS